MTVFERVGLGEDGKKRSFLCKCTLYKINYKTEQNCHCLRTILKDGSHKISFLQLHLMLWQYLAS